MSVRRIYDRLAPVLAMIIILSCAGLAGAIYVNDRNDRDRDRVIATANAERIAENERLLECFDRFAAALAGGLPPVRVASAARDDALEKALAALRGALSGAISGTVTPKDVRAVVRLFTAYEAAAAELDRVRADNPYPEAPSEFCA